MKNILQKNYGIREIAFYDDTFTVRKDRVKRICELIIKKDLDIGFDIRTRVDTLDEEWGSFESYVSDGLDLSPSDVRQLQGDLLDKRI